MRLCSVCIVGVDVANKEIVTAMHARLTCQLDPNTTTPLQLPHYSCPTRFVGDIVCNLNATVAFTYFISPTDNGTIFKIAMSFGFSVSDFLAVYQLASKIRKEFVGAPSQFKAITDE